MCYAYNLLKTPVFDSSKDWLIRKVLKIIVAALLIFDILLPIS